MKRPKKVKFVDNQGKIYAVVLNGKEEMLLLNSLKFTFKDAVCNSLNWLIHCGYPEKQFFPYLGIIL